jgi:hypothetical protein
MNCTDPYGYSLSQTAEFPHETAPPAAAGAFLKRADNLKVVCSPPRL